MKNCYFCHRPCDPHYEVRMEFKEWTIKYVERYIEFAHRECLERAEKLFNHDGDRPAAA